MAILLDKFNRSLDMMEISASDACQYSCGICSERNQDHFGELFPTDHILRFTRVMARLGLKKVRLIGREPLLRPDILTLVSGLSAIRPSVEVSLSTNGGLLKDMADGLALAGLDKLFVSIPSIDPEIFRVITGGHDGLGKIMEGIDIARKMRQFPIIIRTPVVRGVNEMSLLEIAEWAIARRLDFYLVECGRNCSDEPASSSSVSLLAELKERYTLTRQSGVSAANNPWLVEEGRSLVKIVTPYASSYCEACNRVWLSAEGMLSLCSRTGERVDLMDMFDEEPTDAEIAEFAAKIPLNKPRGVFYGAAAAKPEPLSLIHTKR